VRYRLERQDRGNCYRWCLVDEGEVLYQLLDLVPLRHASRYRIVDMKCRAARNVSRLVGAEASQWRNQKNQNIKARERHEQR